MTIKPGAYPWKNHDNAWRPAHIHLSLFGDAFRSRLITQMYFPGDPLLEHDPIFQSVRDTAAQQRMISAFDLEPQPEWAIGYRFDIVLEGRNATPRGEPQVSTGPTPSQTIGPFFHDALTGEDRSGLVPPDHPEAVRIEGVVYDGAGDPVPDAMVEIWQANRAGR